MVNVWSRGLAPVLVAGVVSGIALACSERNAATNSDSRRLESTPADRTSAKKPTTASSEPPQARNTPVQGRDAGPTTPTDPGAGNASNGFHLDGADIEYEAGRREPRPRKGRPIELVLRSTPAGAIAAIDGIAIGPTPAVWQGSTDGTPREFTFVLPGYAIARYRFIPMQSGVVHGTLGRLKSEPDAGPVVPAGP